MQNVITKNVATLTERNALRQLPIQISVTRYSTDAFGTVLPDAAIPAAQQHPYPFHLWGEFDRQGGYGIADEVTQKYNTLLLGVFVWGINTPFFFANPLADVNNRFKKGDILFIYVDSLTAPNFYHFITLSNGQGGLASIVSQSNVSQIDDNGAWGVFRCLSIDYIWDNDDQLDLPFFAITANIDRSFGFDTYNPKQKLSPMFKPNVRVIRLPIQMLVNQYNGLSSYLHFNSQSLQLLFNLYM